MSVGPAVTPRRRVRIEDILGPPVPLLPLATTSPSNRCAPVACILPVSSDDPKRLRTLWRRQQLFARFAAQAGLGALPDNVSPDVIVDVVNYAVCVASVNRPLLLFQELLKRSRKLLVLRRVIGRYAAARRRRIAVMVAHWRSHEASLRSLATATALADAHSSHTGRSALPHGTFVPDELKAAAVRTLHRHRHTEYRTEVRRWRQSRSPGVFPIFAFSPATVTVPDLVGVLWSDPATMLSGPRRAAACAVGRLRSSSGASTAAPHRLSRGDGSLTPRPSSGDQGNTKSRPSLLARRLGATRLPTAAAVVGPISCVSASSSLATQPSLSVELSASFCSAGSSPTNSSPRWTPGGPISPGSPRGVRTPSSPRCGPLLRTPSPDANDCGPPRGKAPRGFAARLHTKVGRPTPHRPAAAAFILAAR